MKEFMDSLAEINGQLNDFIWVKIGIALLIGVGVIMTIVTKFFQISHIRHWWKNTIGSIFAKDGDATKKTDKKSISQFQSLCTALAATIGTGNIAGVSGAIVVGGAGAVFWMWVAAFFGMMTNYSENILGIYYRRRNKDGEWSGGPMYYLKDGLGSKPGCKYIGKILAFLFACFAILASFGIGNMGQVNKITLNMKSAFFSEKTVEDIGYVFGDVSWINLGIGVALVILGGFIILGGLNRIAAFAERVVPFMAIAYIIGALIIIGANYDSIAPAFASIFKYAFGVRAVAGGATGIAIKEVIKFGCKRGVFSNEAGLGSSVMVHSNSNVKEPVKQGLWGIFEVFADTMVVCTMTALVVLTSGAVSFSNGMPVKGLEDEGATLVADAFGSVFGRPGQMFVAIAVLLFAFTTVLGWSHYGSKAVEYIFGTLGTKIYKVVFTLMIVSGALLSSSLAWDISDTFNGFMMVPNLIGVLALSPLVYKLTKNYVSRNIKGDKSVEPMLSFDPEIQAMQAEALKNE